MPTKHGRYEELLDTIYAAAGDPARWPEALTCASDYIGAIGGGMVYQARPEARGVSILGRMDEELMPVYWQHCASDPVTRAMLCTMQSVPLDVPVTMNGRVDRAIIRRSGFYADFLRPQGIEDSLTVNIMAMALPGGLSAFAFNLSERGLERSAEGSRRFTRLLPHLKRAFDTSLQLGRYADGTRQLATALDLMPNPALLLDARRRITYANPGAEALLRLNDGLSVTREGGLHLAAALPAETAALERALTEALSIANGDDSALQGPLRLTRPSGRAPLLVLPVPLPPPAFAMWELVEAARAMVLIIDPEAQSLEIAEAVQTAFGLTGAEARVAALIGGGLSGPQTAAALGISPETVKTHLARCFAKTGAHSQAGLVRLIGMLPRPAGH